MWDSAKTRRLFVGESGSVALAFAISAIPIMGIAAMSIDYGRALTAQKQLQASLDSAVLAAAAAGDKTQDQLQTIIDTFFTQNFVSGTSSAVPTITTQFSNGNTKTITATATLAVPTTFGRVLGLNDLTVTAESGASTGFGDTELALVLDTTGSMSGAKIDGLKSAAKTLIDNLSASPSAASKLKIALVPFTYYVNVDASNRGANWLSVGNDTSTTTNQCWDTYPNAVYTNPHTVTAMCTNDGVSSSCSWTEYDVSWGQPVQQCGPVTNTVTWNGCVGSRNYPRELQETVTSADPVPGVLGAWCPSAIKRLTSSYQSIKNQIDTMTAGGETYLPSGLAWGWRVLSPNSPFSDGKPYSPQTSKVMVFMTDGANTKSPLYPNHEGSDSTLANALTTEVCTNIKNAGIKIYTIAFDVTDPTITNLLSACASGPPFSYSATTVSDLQAAFTSIGNQLMAVKLTR